LEEYGICINQLAVMHGGYWSSLLGIVGGPCVWLWQGMLRVRVMVVRVRAKRAMLHCRHWISWSVTNWNAKLLLETTPRMDPATMMKIMSNSNGMTTQTLSPMSKKRKGNEGNAILLDDHPFYFNSNMACEYNNFSANWWRDNKQFGGGVGLG
jgi:hypothetical protein